METRIFCTANLNPWHNLAMEEFLLSRVRQRECILYLWQNQNTVVIGKNQNAWRECRTQLLEEEGAKLARRISGGGAVFHDTGNLNFSFLVDREYYSLEKQLQVILQAVHSLGIGAVFSGRNDLTVDGRKFSGNAFCLRPQSALHHGTILVSADMEKLTRYLQVSQEKMRSKGVDSVRARVVNLKEYVPSLTIEKTKDTIIQAFQQVYGGNPEIIKDMEETEKAIGSLYDRHASWQWRYGESPNFDIEFETRFPWGGLQIGLQLKNGKIAKAWIYSDAMDESFMEIIPGALSGCIFHSPEMAERVLNMSRNQENDVMARDIARWIEEKKF